jgi:hypothetical protein
MSVYRPQYKDKNRRVEAHKNLVLPVHLCASSYQGVRENHFQDRREESREEATPRALGGVQRYCRRPR